MTIPLFEVKDSGRIKEIKEGILLLEGLPTCIYGQILKLVGIEAYGMVLGFDERLVSVLPFFPTAGVDLGQEMIVDREFFRLPVGESYLGRIVSALGIPMDGKAKIKEKETLPVFYEAPGVMERQPLTDLFPTGIKILDTMIPVGKGQRELILGDRQTGKTAIALDTIINQKGRGVPCVYCWIGGAAANLAKVLKILTESGAIEYTAVISADASSSMGEQYLAPYVAATLGEYFMQKGGDSLVVFDDLTKHAWMYRQISLLMGRAPGREAYPGDIFYLHSQLVERSGRLSEKLGGGSMTFLPIMETLQGDITGYVQSNMVSMTDGQIYLNSELFNEGFRPAIDIGLSVSRIGGKIQPPALKEVSKGLRLGYLQYTELLRLMRLRTKMSDEAKEKMRRGEALTTMLMQGVAKPVELVEEVMLFFAFSKKVLEILSPEGRIKFQNELMKYALENTPELVEKIKEKCDLTPEIQAELTSMFGDLCREKEIF